MTHTYRNTHKLTICGDDDDEDGGGGVDKQQASNRKIEGVAIDVNRVIS